MKLFLFLSLFSCSVFATTIRVPPSANIATEGLHTVVDMVKQGGDHVQTARGAAAAERAVAANGALRNQNALDIAAQNARRGVPTTSPMPASSLAKKAMKVGGAVGAAAAVACVVVDFVSGKSCDQRKSEGIQAIKDWMDHGALGTDPDGNPTEKMPNLNCNGGTKSLQSACTWGLQFHPTATQAIITQMFDGSWTGPNGNYQAYCNYKDVNGDGVGNGARVGCSYIDATTIDIPISVDDAQKKLESTPISPAEKDKIVEVLDQVATQKNDQSYQPEADDPVIDDGDYTDKSPSNESSRTTPDGKTITKKDQIDCFKTGSARLECQKVTTEKTTYPDGTTANDVTATAPTAEDLGFSKDSPIQKSSGFDCALNPELIMCSKWGTLPTAEKLTVKEVPITIDNKSLGAGTCPAPKSINLSGGQTMSLSYQPECDFATKIKPIILAFVWLTAGFIVVGGVKES